jgi:triosephosphate isomerase (TIM)
MRMPLIAGNWKMNTTVDEAVALVKEMLSGLDAVDNIEKLVCPPFISLISVGEVLKGSSVKLGSQNLHYKEKGAYTGEISPLMLAGICEYVIIGHSERRQYFGDTSEVVNKKVQAALGAGLKPILCIGESLDENESGKTEEVVTGQLRQSLAGIDYPGSFVIAYEPVWAIGTGRAATGTQANDTISLVRRTITDLWSPEAGDDIRILYGGSVTAANTTEFLSQPDIDGALVGGASLKPNEFVSIVRQTADIQ